MGGRPGVARLETKEERRRDSLRGGDEGPRGGRLRKDRPGATRGGVTDLLVERSVGNVGERKRERWPGGA